MCDKSEWRKRANQYKHARLLYFLISSCTFLVLFTVKYSRDPSKFYAAKLQKSLQDGDTDTLARVILTSTTV